MWHGIPEYLAAVAVVAVVVHSLIRQWLVACPIGIVFCSIANLVHEAWLVNFQVNIGWAPFDFIAGCILAFPIVAVVGLPFVWFRQKRHGEPP